MSLLSSGRREARSADSLASILGDSRPVRSSAGGTVTTDSAMRLGAVWSCVNFLADLVATLPVDTYRRGPNGRVEVTTPPVIASPSATVDRIGWTRQLMTSLLLSGNAWAQVQSVSALGYPTQLEVLPPSLVTPYRNGTTGSWYVNVAGERHDLWPAGDIWHVAAFQVAGSPVGLSPIAHARQSIGLGIAAEEHAARWFADGAHPTMVVKSGRPMDQAAARTVKQRIVDAVAGREPLVIGGDLDVSPWQVTLADSQFLDAIEANTHTVRQFFFPHLLLGESASMTYANVEQRSLDLLTYSVTPWLVRLEAALSALLPAPQYVKYNAAAIVRVDSATRYNMHDKALRGGWRSRDEIRQLEDLAPLPDGTGAEYLWPPYRAFPIESDQQ